MNFLLVGFGCYSLYLLFVGTEWSLHSVANAKCFPSLFFCLSFFSERDIWCVSTTFKKAWEALCEWKWVENDSSFKEHAQHHRLVVFCGTQIRTQSILPKNDIRILRVSHLESKKSLYDGPGWRATERTWWKQTWLSLAHTYTHTLHFMDKSLYVKLFMAYFSLGYFDMD